nr:hypothetical protein [Tanacetum cinerariifolium]
MESKSVSKLWDKYVAKILRKFGLTDGKSASTPIDTKKPLLKDLDDDLSFHTTKYTSPALTQKVFSNMRRIGKGFSRVETPLFATMLVQPHAAAEEEDDDDEVSTAPTPPSPTPVTTPTSPTHKPSPPLPEPTSPPPQAQPVPPSSPPQEQPTQPTHTSKSSMTLLNNLMETYYQAQAEGQEVRKEEENKAFWFKEVKEGWGKITELDADKDVTLVDVDTAVEKDADIQGRMEEDVTAIKQINAAEPEPTVFDDEEVTITMAQTLIKMKAEKERILDE